VVDAQDLDSGGGDVYYNTKLSKRNLGQIILPPTVLSVIVVECYVQKHLRNPRMQTS